MNTATPDRDVTLYVDAFSLAMELTARVRDKYKRGKLEAGDRLLELGRRAWKRHHRRRKVLVKKGILAPIQVDEMFE